MTTPVVTHCASNGKLSLASSLHYRVAIGKHNATGSRPSLCCRVLHCLSSTYEPFKVYSAHPGNGSAESLAARFGLEAANRRAMAPSTTTENMFKARVPLWEGFTPARHLCPTNSGTEVMIHDLSSDG